MTKKNLILSGFLVFKLTIHCFLINAGYDLHRDEYLHLDQARHLAWGYLSVPPVTSWIAIIISILGNSIFWVKFFPALFGALTLFVVWKTIEELKGNLFALILGAVTILFSVILRINILFQPNSLDILFWTACYFAVVKYINSENPKWIYILSLTFAFGFLNKYNIVFLFLGLLPALLLTGYRKLFLSKHLYYSAILALIIILPNLIWQYRNDFPVFSHLKELTQTQLENLSRTDFLKEQILFFIGSIYVLIAAFLAFFIHQPIKKYQIILWSFLFTMMIFIYFKAKGYYAIGLYPVLIAFGATFIERLLDNGRIRYLRPIAILLPIILFCSMLKVVFPISSPEVIQQEIQSFKDFGLLRWEDGKDHNLPQDFADMLGWKELANKVDSASVFINDTEHTLVLCDNYGQAGAINFYSKIENMQAVTFNSDYVNWFPFDKKIENIILIKEITDPERGKKTQNAQFEKVMTFDEVTNPFAREKGTTIYVLMNAKVDINSLLKDEILEKGSRR